MKLSKLPIWETIDKRWYYSTITAFKKINTLTNSELIYKISYGIF